MSVPGQCWADEQPTSIQYMAKFDAYIGPTSDRDQLAIWDIADRDQLAIWDIADLTSVRVNRLGPWSLWSEVTH